MQKQKQSALGISSRQNKIHRGVQQELLYSVLVNIRDAPVFQVVVEEEESLGLYNWRRGMVIPVISQ